MNTSDIILYTTPQGEVRIEVLFENETFWLPQKKLAELFDVEVPTVNYHLKEIYKSGELQEVATIRRIRIVQLEGGREVGREVEHYNLDTIIAVGYRVNSQRATKFRIWATNTLKEYIIKGFVLDDARMKQGKNFREDYFEELLERIRDIRASERRFYQKICTYARLLRQRAERVAPGHHRTNGRRDHLRRSGFRQTLPRPADVEARAQRQDPEERCDGGQELLGRRAHRPTHPIVGAYLDLAEDRAKRGIVMRMADWQGFLKTFLELAAYPLLTEQGRVTALEAKLKAEGEYEKYRAIQDKTYESDFDREVKRLTGERAEEVKGDMPKGASKGPRRE